MALYSIGFKENYSFTLVNCSENMHVLRNEWISRRGLSLKSTANIKGHLISIIKTWGYFSEERKMRWYHVFHSLQIFMLQVGKTLRLSVENSSASKEIDIKYWHKIHFTSGWKPSKAIIEWTKYEVEMSSEPSIDQTCKSCSGVLIFESPNYPLSDVEKV